MNIKNYMAMAVVALTAACSESPVDDHYMNESVQLNADGSVKTVVIVPPDESTVEQEATK